MDVPGPGGEQVRCIMGKELWRMHGGNEPTWEGLARALVFLGQMFQRGGGVQPAARPSFKCLFSVLLTFHGFGARLNWSGRSGSAHSADFCFFGYVFFGVDCGGLRPAARAALASFL